MKKLDLVGKQFGYLTVMKFVGSRVIGGISRRLWQCQCDCGSIVEITSGNLGSGNSTSCGCMKFGGRPGNPTHGKSGTLEHRIWKEMRKRCNNPKSSIYHHYGGRGIRICKRWDNFENFLADMGPAPGADYSIERKNVNRNYCPSNCRWIPRKSQSRNRRDTIRLTLKGETRALVDWADHLGFPVTALKARYYRNWSDERILTTPIR
jgi:hypothetical protein